MSSEWIASIAVAAVAIGSLMVARHLARQSDAAAREVDRLDAEIAERGARLPRP